MDTINQYPLDSAFAERDHRIIYSSERSASFHEHHGSSEGWTMVDVTLSGGAPWGFTLRGGLEHGEPLLITKVEEGSKAAVARLQAGDELLNINNISLTGYRQEAICLVKGSHKTLSLVVKRRNEPMSRPHSWHATKFNESHSEAKTQSTPSAVRQAKYDASSFSSDLSTDWETTNLWRVSDQFSSLGSMDSLGHSSHPYPPGHLSPSKSNNNSVEHLGGGKRDSAYSSFSTSSGTPDYTLSKSNAASTENMLYKINHWDSSGRHSNGRHSRSLSEGVRHDERPGNVHHPSSPGSYENPRTENQPGTRHSSSGRANIGPVWHVPDMKKNIASSTPPPTPPTRSDSFVATKVHEKGLITGTFEGLGVHAQVKPLVKGLHKVVETHDSTLKGRNDYILPSKNDSSNSYISADTHHQYPQRISSDKTYSLSTTDIRDRLPSYTHIPYHPRQYSDESNFHAQTKTVPPIKPPFTGYYSSMQELHTNNHMQLNSQIQGSRPAASLSGLATDPETSSQSYCYGVTSHQTPQGMSQGSLMRADDSKASSVSEMSHGGRDRMSVGSQGGTKERYFPPQSYHHDPDHKNNNACSKLIDNHHRISSNPLNMPNSATAKPELRGSQKQNHMSSSDMHSGSYSPSKQTEHRSAGHLHSKEYSKQPLPATNESKICPQKTPMLYSLAQENNDMDDYQDELNSGSVQQEALDSQSGKQARRSERFATTLRNEIQMRRAQLQKSQSASTLGSPVEAVEEAAIWKSTGSSSSCSDGSFSNSYKDHLKEAQARVLQATSFRRKDLEPVLFEHPGTEAATWRETPPLPIVSEIPPVKPISGSNQMLRIGSRKRFSAEKKILSFSEPDKIHEVGADERSPLPDNAALLENRSKFFEATGKPAFSKPIPKQNLQISEYSRLSRPGGIHHPAKSNTAGQNNNGSTTPSEQHLNEGQDGPQSVNRKAMLERQRLGTFAEYEAKWSTQRNTTEPRVSGRYHSADNILDTGIEKRSKPTCVHERSRSSPSADFYGQKVPVQEKRSADYSRPERNLFEQDKNETGMERLKDENTSVKKVPIKIVHSESDTEKESRQYLDLPNETPLSSQESGVTHLQSLGNPDQSYSLFCTYTRQKDQGPEPRDTVMGLLKDQEPQTNINPVSHVVHSLKTVPLSDQSSNGVSSHSSRVADDEKRRELAKDIMDKDKTLVEILDQSKMKTTMDLMEGIFPLGEQLLEEAQQRRKAVPKQLSPRNSVEKKEEDSPVAATALVTNSTYYSTSAPKAELLIKMKDMQDQSVEHMSEEELEEDNENDLASKKHELIDSLSKKLQVLREAQESLQDDVHDNNALGEEVEAIVQRVCKPNELDKFRMFVGDLDKVVNLLLSLSGRLARVENALNSLEDDASMEERRTLTEKRKLLIRQHEDAKELKENLDRRERVVYEILASYLAEESMADYEHFVKMKSALIIEQRKLEDKIKLGEEQLKCLMDSLPMDQRTAN
ncbi:protein Shroom2-like isoform X5 [Myxocyprinus asiaticus]|uniref:protein Shroom2-like isoform X5 n=1 Tax=Myxocyprinus asiaticus TaxID=70543 RepID=UPI002222D406|nr:protein Shroom2-like isoform X5 [Myxocyprinus asiaticus]